MSAFEKIEYVSRMLTYLNHSLAHRVKSEVVTESCCNCMYNLSKYRFCHKLSIDSTYVAIDVRFESSMF